MARRKRRSSASLPILARLRRSALSRLVLAAMNRLPPKFNLLDGYLDVQTRMHTAQTVKNGALWNLHSTKAAAARPAGRGTSHPPRPRGGAAAASSAPRSAH